MSRFAVDPRWLIYVPPTMAPCRAAPEGELVERPAEAFEHYRKRGVKTVVCQDKHMGSRGIVVVTRDGSHGCIYTRTGRRFFDDPERETAVLDRFRTAFDEAGLWRTLKTDWACLDCEIMPWNAKGAGLIKRHFTPVATAGRMGLTKAIEALRTAAERDASHEQLLHAMEHRREMTEQYDVAYRRYSWPVETIEDLKIAPFHLMATEGAVHVDKSHHWHMATIDALCRQDPILCTTEHLTVDVTDDEQVASATDWWTCQTSAGHEGMVMKPLDFVTRTERGLVAPAVKCRGREYLQIIYGPEYTREDQMARLRKRTVGRYVTRKGAIRAWRDDRGIVPGSMGTRSYIVRVKGCSEALDSCPHGAGRRMSRTQAKARYNAADMVAQTQGVECRKDEGVIDEIPNAYKNIDEVMSHASQLVEIEHTLKQVICVKG